MKINKAQLQKALEIVKPGLANRKNEMIDQSTSFAFIENTVMTYNDEISISHPVEGLNLTGAVRAEELYQFLNKVKKDEITISTTENEIVLKAGKAKAGFVLQQEITMPVRDIEQKTDWVDLPDGFLSALSFVVDSCSKDMSRPVLTCVHVSGGDYIQASDGFQITMCALPESSAEMQDVLIPATAVRELTKLAVKQIAYGEEWILFRTDDDTVFSCRMLSESYPNTSHLMEVKGQKITFSNRMSEILERAMIFTKQEHQFDEELEVVLTEGQVTVKGKNDYGWFEESAREKYKGEQASFRITPSLLKNVLTRSNTCTLGKERIKFQDQDWQYVAGLRNQ